MMLLLDVAARSSIVLLAGLALSALLRRQPASLRHAVLAMSICAAAALVPLTAIVPEWSVPPPAFAQPRRTLAAGGPAQERVVVTAGEAPRRSTSIDVIAVIWAFGLGASALALLTAYARLRRIARRARRVDSGAWVNVAEEIGRAYGLRGPVTILQTDAADMLATFGAWRPHVLLPAPASRWSDDRIRAVLSHELAHVRRRDWLVQMAAEALRCLYWFNPLAWIACARLRSESEYACDDAVLGCGMSARDYATHLVELARVCRPPRASLSAMPMARASTLERRITAMLNPGLNRRPVSRRALAAAAVTLACIAVSAAAVRAGQAAQTSPATLTGSVYDPTAAVMPGVSLTLKDEKEGKWIATTTAAGRFEFPSIAPGRYVLEATLPGFRTFRQDLTLRSPHDWDRAITLQVGELRETITVQASRVTATGPSQPQPTRLKVGGNIRAPRKLHDVKPVYPVSMREAGREGIVPLEANIGPDGSVTSVRVLTADVHPDFAIAAAEAVRQWRFDPTLLNGAPVEVRMAVSIEFKLSN